VKHPSLAPALHRLWKRYRNALKKCQAHFTEKAVHDSRVETRRMEAQFELLKVLTPARLLKRARRALEKHLDCFDTLRDTQVQLRLLRRDARDVPGTEALRESLRLIERECLEKAARNVRRVKTGRVRKLTRALRDQLQRAERDPNRQVRDRRVIVRAVDAAQARVAARSRRMDPGNVATLHQTRIAFKKLRYMIEAIKPLFAAITEKRIKAMSQLQTQFGDLQDTEVFLTELDRFVRKQTAQAPILAPLRHWLLTRRGAQIQECMEDPDQLLQFWPLASPGPKPRRIRRVTPKNASPKCHPPKS
jgi:CHAD domain-containing protein